MKAQAAHAVLEVQLEMSNLGELRTFVRNYQFTKLVKQNDGERSLTCSQTSRCPPRHEQPAFNASVIIYCCER